MMLFPGWQIGLDIQADGVRAVAVQRYRQGWRLRRWWHLPFSVDAPQEGILPQPEAVRETLRVWRREIPKCHCLRVSFAVQRVLQRQIPGPDSRLQESAREHYVAGAAARQLQMPASQLYCDYCEQRSPLEVVAAHRSDVDSLLAHLASVQLVAQAVTPGDKVLNTLTPASYPLGTRWLVHQEAHYWLWAQTGTGLRSGWVDKRQAGDLPALCRIIEAKPDLMALSCAQPQPEVDGVAKLDVWRQITRLHPPLPAHGGLYTVALGLAMGGLRG